MYYEVKQTLSGRWANSSLHTHTHTQLLAQQPKWGIRNSIVDYQNSTTATLPTIPNPDYTQNAVWDANGNLMIYEVDGMIYDKNGGVNKIVHDVYNIYSTCHPYETKTHYFTIN